MENINDRIKQMRTIWRLTPEKVAELAGLTLDNYLKLELEPCNIGMELALKLCEIFKISLDFLMTGTKTEKDIKAINRPLTKEERMFDKMEEVKKNYSPEIYKKYYDYLSAIYLDEPSKYVYRNPQEGNCLSFEQYLLLDDYEFLSELCNNGLFDLKYANSKVYHEHKQCSNILEALSYDLIFDNVINKKLSDPKFIDYLVEKDPVKTLNYYYLRCGMNLDDLDKKGILKCLDAGGYIEKIVEAHYYTDYTHDWDDGEAAVEYIKGQDVFATMQLREYCLKN